MNQNRCAFRNQAVRNYSSDPHTANILELRLMAAPDILRKAKIYTYIHGIDFDRDKYWKELKVIVDSIKKDITDNQANRLQNMNPSALSLLSHPYDPKFDIDLTKVTFDVLKEEGIIPKEEIINDEIINDEKISFYQKVFLITHGFLNQLDILLSQQKESQEGSPEELIKLIDQCNKFHNLKAAKIIFDYHLGRKIDEAWIEKLNDKQIKDLILKASAFSQKDFIQKLLQLKIVEDLVKDDLTLIIHVGNEQWFKDKLEKENCVDTLKNKEYQDQLYELITIIDKNNQTEMLKITFDKIKGQLNSLDSKELEAIFDIFIKCSAPTLINDFLNILKFNQLQQNAKVSDEIFSFLLKKSFKFYKKSLVNDLLFPEKPSLSHIEVLKKTEIYNIIVHNHDQESIVKFLEKYPDLINSKQINGYQYLGSGQFVNEESYNVLQYAMDLDLKDVLQFLIEQNNIDLDVKTSSHENLLMMAIRFKHLKVVDFLLKKLDSQKLKEQLQHKIPIEYSKYNWGGLLDRRIFSQGYLTYFTCLKRSFSSTPAIAQKIWEIYKKEHILESTLRDEFFNEIGLIFRFFDLSEIPCISQIILNQEFAKILLENISQPIFSKPLITWKFLQHQPTLITEDSWSSILNSVLRNIYITNDLSMYDFVTGTYPDTNENKRIESNQEILSACYKIIKYYLGLDNILVLNKPIQFKTYDKEIILDKNKYQNMIKTLQEKREHWIEYGKDPKNRLHAQEALSFLSESLLKELEELGKKLFS